MTTRVSRRRASRRDDDRVAMTSLNKNYESVDRHTHARRLRFFRSFELQAWFLRFDSSIVPPTTPQTFY